MTISNTALFKQAHAMTRATIQAGDDYRATFGLCLKAIKEEQAAKKVFNVSFFVMAMIVLALVKIEKALDIENTYAIGAVFIGVLAGIGLLGGLHIVNVFTLFFTGSFLI